MSFIFPQILNIDRIRSTSDTAAIKNLNSLITLGFNIKREDATVIDLKTSAEISYAFKNNLLISISHYELTSTENVKLINSGYSHLRFRFNRESSLQPELFTQYQWNGVRGMKYRYLAGANLRFLLNKDSSNVSYFAIGLMNERESWDFRSVPANQSPNSPGDVNTNFVKINCYLNIDWMIKKDVDLSFILYAQSKPNADIIYPRVSQSMQFNVGLSEYLGISFNLNCFYDSKPVVPIRKFYYDLSTAISISF